MMSSLKKDKKWFKPLFDFNEETPPAKYRKKHNFTKAESTVSNEKSSHENKDINTLVNVNHKHFMKNFDPVTVDDLAIHSKKVQEVDEWMKSASNNNSDMLLLSGPVGCGKTITVSTLAAKNHIKVTEWITPLDIEMPSEYGDYEYKEKQSVKFLDFIINAANFTSLLDNNSKKIVLVEDFPNTFMRTPSEFTDILWQYKQRAKSPIVFICSESHADSRNTAIQLFTPSLKEQFNIKHIVFNSVSATGLRSALKRVSEIISKKHSIMYNIPTSDLIECVVNSSAGDIRSAVLNLHFACLKGSVQNLEISVVKEMDMNTKHTKKKKQIANKFSSLGKDQGVGILHGVGRVLNPKVAVNEDGMQQFSHSPKDITEEFLSQPNSFVNFLRENYLHHFSNIDHILKAASALSDADLMLTEWREKMCQEYGLYTAIAGLMLANKTPVSAWNPVRGAKNMKIQYPSPSELLLDENYLYIRKTLVTDYKTYTEIIAGKR